MYQGGAAPGNGIRVVDITGIDAKACCDTHCDALSEIGSIKIISANKEGDGVFRLGFVAGRLATASRLADQKLLRDVQGVFKVEASLLLDNCKRFFAGRNAFMGKAGKLAMRNFQLLVQVHFARHSEVHH
jgi:alanyl-tRNA synthetase